MLGAGSRWRIAGGPESPWVPPDVRGTARVARFFAEAEPVSSAVLLNHRFVQHEAEPGLRAYRERPVSDAWTVGPHRLPHRVALGVREALHVGSVGNRRQQVARDLRLLVVRHLDARRRAERGGAPPLADTAALGGVEVDEVDGAGVEHPAHAVAGDLALARRDRDARGVAHARHQGDVVVPVTRLLEPADVERLDQTGEADGVLRRPAP